MSTFTLTNLHEAVMGIVDQIVADHADYPLVVEIDNRDLVDQATQTQPYLQVTIAPMSGEQAELGNNPNVKQDGQILIAAVVKIGAGTLEAKKLLDFVLPYFSLQAHGPLQLQAAWATPGKGHLGLWYQPAIVPYHYFSRSA